MNESLRNMLRRLRLSGLTETLEVRLLEASGNRLSHLEFLELILQDELLGQTAWESTTMDSFIRYEQLAVSTFAD